MKSQKQQILEILLDGEPHRSDEFQERMFGSTKYGLFRLGARIWDLKQEGHLIRGWRDSEWPTLYWYQLLPKSSPIEQVVKKEEEVKVLALF